MEKVRVEIAHILTSEQLEELGKQVYLTTVEALEKAKESVGEKQLMNKQEACSFLGCSPQFLEQLIRDGLPIHRMSERIFYLDRDEILTFIKSK